jgi:hypothetical protein
MRLGLLFLPDITDGKTAYILLANIPSPVCKNAKPISDRERGNWQKSSDPSLYTVYWQFAMQVCNFKDEQIKINRIDRLLLLSRVIYGVIKIWS